MIHIHTTGTENFVLTFFAEVEEIKKEMEDRVSEFLWAMALFTDITSRFFPCEITVLDDVG